MSGAKKLTVFREHRMWEHNVAWSPKEVMQEKQM